MFCEAQAKGKQGSNAQICKIVGYFVEGSCKYICGLNRRPADLLIPFASSNGQDLCLVVTVTAALKNEVIDCGAEEPDHMANKAGGKGTRWGTQ